MQVEPTMKQHARYQRRAAPRIGSRVALVFAAIGMAVAGVPAAAQTSEDAPKILKAMTDYVSAQKNISATYDADVEVITSQLQKLQFTSSGELTMGRPDKLRVTRSGGYSELELVFNGATATLLEKHTNNYAQINTAGSVDQLVDRLRDDLQTTVPGADLLLARAYNEMMDDVIEAKYIGHGVIDGVECDHLAFRNLDTDWQLWVERGLKPIPRKYVITSKATAAAPQYTLRIKSWATDAPAGADAFAFKAPAGAKLVDVKELKDIDEVPPGQTTGEKK
jgi:hypothetical protein